jgi:hypothetical protein
VNTRQQDQDRGIRHRSGAGVRCGHEDNHEPPTAWGQRSQRRPLDFIMKPATTTISSAPPRPAAAAEGAGGPAAVERSFHVLLIDDSLIVCARLTKNSGSNPGRRAAQRGASREPAAFARAGAKDRCRSATGQVELAPRARRHRPFSS